MPRQMRRRVQDVVQLHRAGYVLPVGSQTVAEAEAAAAAAATALECMTITCIMPGPADTPYHGKRWRVSISLPPEYPFKSPSVGFVDTIFHPNVEQQSGSVCLNALNSEWTPVYKLTAIIDTLLPQLLSYPNAHDPMNAIAAQQWEHDRAAYNARVAELPGYVAVEAAEEQ